MFKKKFPSLSSLGSDGNTAFLRAARAGHLDKVLEHLKANIDINTSNTNGLNALHLASKDGHVSVVTELLKRGAVVDSATKKGNTALHIASLAGQEDVVKLLVASGASVNVQSQNGFTPLYMAAQENHDNVVKFLLANCANQSLATEDGFTPLAVAMQQGHDKVVAVLLENDTRGKVRLPALHIAAKKDDCKAAALLLQNDHNPDVTSKSGFTPLHIAAHYGNEGIANLLLNRGADVNYSAKHNISPLHVAAKWGKTNLVSLLLEKGATIESKTRDGLTPLHCAARSGHEQVVDMMLEREAPISSKTKNGLAPLHMAAQGDHVDAARILLYHRAPVDEVTVDYLTALHVAAHCGHVRVAKLLLDRKADPNARALNGFTPLHIACKKNRIKVVELLLKHGGSIEATTESGLTPLHVASFMGCMNIVIFLLQNDASPDVPTVRGETPLHLAARANQTDIIRILLRNGAQVDARAREQQTPLHIASRLGNVDIVMLLLQHGAAVDSTTKDMYTALHIAAKEGQEEVASVLLEHGASLTATTKKGFTPLHLAAKYGNIKVAKLLLQKEAPVDAQGKNGVTPLHVASHYDHQNVALLLLDKGASPHATAKNGHTPLHIAARKNQMDIATTLLEYGAKANAESKAGFTPLHLSAQEGHTDMSTLLIEHQADTNHKAKNGLTPLHLCAQEDRVNVATILVKSGAQVDSTTKAGYTPLHVASHFGQVNMIRFLLDNDGDVAAATSVGYTPLHQAAQQGHTTIVGLLLENAAPPNTQTNQGQTALSIAQKLGYISVVETLKGVTEPTITNVTATTTTAVDEKYRVVAPETMQETFMSDSEDEGGEDTMLSDQPYRYLTVDEMKSLGDDSLPIDVTRDERMDSNRECMAPPQAVDDTISPQHVKESYSQFAANYTQQSDNIDISRQPVNVGFLVSFLVDARGGAMRGCRHSGVRVIVPPRKAAQPMRVTCRYLKRDKLSHPPPLMEGEALASRILELGPVGGKFLGPVIIEVPHFGSLRGMEREIVILRSDNGETWREHTLEASDEAIHDVLNESFEADEISALEEPTSGRTTRILTTDFPQYFAVVSRIRQEVHAIGPEGGMVSSSVVPQVQAVFPQGALTKKIKVGLQAQPIPAELAAKLLGNRVAVSPIVTVEPRRRKFHKPITLTIPVPQAANKGMINQYSGDAPTLRLLCSITGGTTRAQWEDVTGSTPLTFVNDCVSFTTTVSARFWLMDCRNIADATKMATELYREAIHVPFMAKFVVFAKRTDVSEARLRVFCMTDDKEDKTLEHQEHFTEVAKSRDVEVLEGKPQYVEFSGNLVPVTKSGDQLQLGFRAFRENRLPFTVRVKDPHADTVGRVLFMREGRIAKGEPPQQPICILNIVLPGDIVPEPIILEADLQSLNKKYSFLRDGGLGRLESYQRTDLRLSDISNLIGQDWVPLAHELDITTSDVNLIKSECPASVAQQAMTMLRLWLQQAGNKGNGNTLETALRKIGRDDIVEQCIFNVEEVKQRTVRSDQLRDATSRDRDLALRRNISLDVAFDEQDIMKESESVEELVQAERIVPVSRRQDSDSSESKYIGEEKVVVEEQKSVSALKELFAQDKRDRQYERQPSVSEMSAEEPRSRPLSTVETRTISTADERPKSSVETVERIVERELPESETFTVEEIRQKFSASQPESITTVTKVTKKTSGIPITTTKTTVTETVSPKTPEIIKKTSVTEIVKTPDMTKKITEVKKTVVTEVVTPKTPDVSKRATGIPSLSQKDVVKDIKSKTETTTETTTETVTQKVSGIPQKTAEIQETITRTVSPKTIETKITSSTPAVSSVMEGSEFVSKTTSEVTVTTKTSGIPVVTKTTKVIETVSRSGDDTTDVTTIDSIQKASADQRRDSELFQGVSEELGRLETTFKVVPVEDGILSPKTSKTPPPSPAEFNRDQTAAPANWSSGGGTLGTVHQTPSQEWRDKSQGKDGVQSLGKSSTKVEVESLEQLTNVGSMLDDDANVIRKKIEDSKRAAEEEKSKLFSVESKIEEDVRKLSSVAVKAKEDAVHSVQNVTSKLSQDSNISAKAVTGLFLLEESKLLDKDEDSKVQEKPDHGISKALEFAGKVAGTVPIRRDFSEEPEETTKHGIPEALEVAGKVAGTVPIRRDFSEEPEESTAHGITEALEVAGKVAGTVPICKDFSVSEESNKHGIPEALEVAGKVAGTIPICRDFSLEDTTSSVLDGASSKITEALEIAGKVAGSIPLHHELEELEKISNKDVTVNVSGMPTKHGVADGLGLAGDIAGLIPTHRRLSVSEPKEGECLEIVSENISQHGIAENLNLTGDIASMTPIHHKLPENNLIVEENLGEISKDQKQHGVVEGLGVAGKLVGSVPLHREIPVSESRGTSQHVVSEAVEVAGHLAGSLPIRRDISVEEFKVLATDDIPTQISKEVKQIITEGLEVAGKIASTVPTHQDISSDDLIDEIKENIPKKIGEEVKHGVYEGLEMASKIAGTVPIHKDLSVHETKDLNLESASKKISVELHHGIDEALETAGKVAGVVPTRKEIIDSAESVQQELSDEGNKFKETSSANIIGGISKIGGKQSPEKKGVSFTGIQHSATVIEVNPQSKEPSPQPNDNTPYVTTPTLSRRGLGVGGSQRLTRDQRPPPLDVTHMPDDDESDDDDYIVTEPADDEDNRLSQDSRVHSSPDILASSRQLPFVPTEPEVPRRRPMFHIESEEDDLADMIVDGSNEEFKGREFKLDMGQTIKVTDVDEEEEEGEREDEVVKGFMKVGPLGELVKGVERIKETMTEKLIDGVKVVEKKVEVVQVMKQEGEGFLIETEDTFSDEFDKALGNSEQLDEDAEKLFEALASKEDEHMEKKLRRVERRFERMASETLDRDVVAAATVPEAEQRREAEFQRMISQLSTDEVIAGQKDFSQLWDEGGAMSVTPSEEWDSASREPDTPSNELDDDSPQVVMSGDVISPSLSSKVTYDITNIPQIIIDNYDSDSSDENLDTFDMNRYRYSSDLSIFTSDDNRSYMSDDFDEVSLYTSDEERGEEYPVTYIDFTNPKYNKVSKSEEIQMDGNNNTGLESQETTVEDNRERNIEEDNRPMESVDVTVRPVTCERQRSRSRSQLSRSACSVENSPLGDATSEWAPREAQSTVTTTTTTTTRGADGLVTDGADGAQGGVTVTTTETRVVEGSEDMQELLAKLAAEQRK